MRLLVHFVIEHWLEIVIAAVFAIMFGVIADFLQPASRFRAAVRHIKNKLAEESAARLRTRITETETFRNRVAAYLASDKTHYLAALQLILGMQLFMCMGAVMVVLGHVMPALRQLEFFGLAPIGGAIGLGVHAMRVTSWDTPPKLSEAIAKLDKEIAGLRTMLTNLTRR